MWFKKKSSRPTSAEAAKRLVVLQFVTLYSQVTPPRDVLAQSMAGWSTADRKSFEADMEKLAQAHWSIIRSEGLWSSLSPTEVALASATPATMTLRQHLDAMWRIESVIVLRWALGLLPTLPPADSMAPGDFLESNFVSDIKAFVDSARLRSDPEIDRAREIAETWHWRSRTRQLTETGEPFRSNPAFEAKGIRSYDDIARMVAPEAAKDGTIPEVIDGDFPARGKAYRDLTSEEWFEVQSITMERHFTLNWLCGKAPKNQWDKTPTNT